MSIWTLQTNMRLYNTSTSERASKGQGGNKYIKSTFTVDKDPKSEMIVVQCAHDNGDVSFSVRMKTDDGYIEVYRNLYKGNQKNTSCGFKENVFTCQAHAHPTKGNKQKDEFMACEACGLDIKIRRDTNDKIILENCPHCDN